MMDAILMAGSTPDKKDELLEYTGVDKKSLIKVAGREMIYYVFEALVGCRRIDRFVLVGLGPEDGLDFGRPVEYVEAHGDILDNSLAGLNRLTSLNPAVDRVILSSTDIPLLTTEVVDYLIDACLELEADIYYSVVEKSVMEARFPHSGRTFVRLRDGLFAGGDLFMIRARAVRGNLPLFRRLIDARKSAWQLARIIGLKMIFKFLIGQLTIAESEKMVGRALNCRVKAIVSPYAEIGMDVDKVSHLHRVQSILAGEQ
jgi:hypothetical protein